MWFYFFNKVCLQSTTLKYSRIYYRLPFCLILSWNKRGRCLVALCMCRWKNMEKILLGKLRGRTLRPFQAKARHLYPAIEYKDTSLEGSEFKKPLHVVCTHHRKEIGASPCPPNTHRRYLTATSGQGGVDTRTWLAVSAFKRHLHWMVPALCPHCSDSSLQGLSVPPMVPTETMTCMPNKWHLQAKPDTHHLQMTVVSQLQAVSYYDQV